MKHRSLLKIFIILAVTVSIFVAYGCSSSNKVASGGDDLDDLGSFKVEKTGAILWGESCGRCHNAPNPTAFTDEQWVAIGTHMRIRAGLTAEDTKKIIEFLKQSN